MLRDRVEDYYLNQDYNCAETIVRCLSDEYGLSITDEELKMVGGFGGGMGAGYSCGALCGAIAVLGKMMIQDKAHKTEGFGAACGEFTERFKEKLGRLNCSDLAKIYKKEDVRCIETVQLAADLFEEFYQEKKAKMA